MYRHATLTLPPLPSSASSARHFLQRQLTAWGLAELVQDALIIVSELVTNAVVHARRSDIRLEVSLSDGTVTIAVSDDSPVLPERVVRELDLDVLGAHEPVPSGDPREHVRDAGPSAAGRGLQLVAAASHEWGVTQLEAGKTVWAKL